MVLSVCAGRASCICAYNARMHCTILIKCRLNSYVHFRLWYRERFNAWQDFSLSCMRRFWCFRLLHLLAFDTPFSFCGVSVSSLYNLNVMFVFLLYMPHNYLHTQDRTGKLSRQCCVSHSRAILGLFADKLSLKCCWFAHHVQKMTLPWSKEKFLKILAWYLYG